jgi:anthranilate synthase component 1
VGFLSYDIVRFFEELPDDTVDDLGVDDCCFLFTNSLLIFDHVKHRLKVLCNAVVGEDAGAAYDLAAAKIEDKVMQLRAADCNCPSTPHPGPIDVTPNITREAFEKAVERCKEYIMAGDAFQVVPSQRFTVKLHCHPFEVYRALRSVNPSPYMYYLDLGDKQIVGSSPEILVTVEDGLVRLRPIAGTRPRGQTPSEDLALETELLADEKERAEHIMLVDLGRNDVGRVAEYGSVKVDELMVIERYSHVMHIVSNVTGKLARGSDVFDVMRASFPAGTLSGAPKVRAMEIIEEVEPTRRGIYGGAVGYFSYNGDMDFAIAIRTALIQNGAAYVQAGGGVVADSVPALEYQESANKAKALLTAIQMAEEGLE